MDEEKSKFRKGLYTALILVLIIWAVEIIENVFELSFVSFGVFPREIEGLVGIITHPFIHSDWEHLISNTFPILLLVTAIFYFYPTASKKVMLLIYIFSGIGLWLIGRPSYHIGASGFVYGLVTFTFFSGIIRWDRRSIVLSLIVTFLYGGFTWGVLPVESGVSWEGHLSGAVVGMICAVIFRKHDPYDKFAGMESEELENDTSV